MSVIVTFISPIFISIYSGYMSVFGLFSIQEAIFGRLSIRTLWSLILGNGARVSGGTFFSTHGIVEIRTRSAHVSCRKIETGFEFSHCKHSQIIYSLYSLYIYNCWIKYSMKMSDAQLWTTDTNVITEMLHRLYNIIYIYGTQNGMDVSFCYNPVYHSCTYKLVFREHR